MNHPLSQFFQSDQAGAIVGYAQGLEKAKIDTFGFADIAKKEAFSSHSLFDIASLSKSFTGAAIALLVQEKEVDLSLPVEAYLPNLKSSGTNRLIKLQDLLWHISDLPDYLGHFSEQQIPSLVSSDIVAFVESIILRCNPGQKFEYSNTNYVLLASVIEAVSGQSYASFLEQRIFQPLALTNTTVIEPGKTLDHLVNGYEKREDGSFSESKLAVYILGDGGVFSTVTDLVSWIQKYVRQNQLLSKDVAPFVFSSGRLDSGDAVNYGAGLMIEDVGNSKWFGHAGSWFGVSTYMGYNPNTDMTFVVLSNQLSAPTHEIRQIYLKYLLQSN